MQEFASKVPNNQVKFFTVLVKNLKFSVVMKDSKSSKTKYKKIIEDIEEGTIEVELHAQDKIKLDDAKSFLLRMKTEKAQLN